MIDNHSTKASVERIQLILDLVEKKLTGFLSFKYIMQLQGVIDETVVFINNLSEIKLSKNLPSASVLIHEHRIHLEILADAIGVQLPKFSAAIDLEIKIASDIKFKSFEISNADQGLGARCHRAGKAFYDWKPRRFHSVEYLELTKMQKGLVFFLKAAECGNIDAMVSLGEYYKVIEEDEASFHWFSMAQSLGSIDGLEGLADWYYDKRRFDMAEPLVKLGMELKSGRAFHLQGFYYYDVAKDYDRAREMWEKAVELGFPRAYTSLAAYYYNRERRVDRFLEYSLHAENQLCVAGLANVGIYYVNIANDKKMAREYLRRSAEGGNGLGMAFYGGLLMDQEEGGMEWFELAGKTNSPSAFYSIGWKLAKLGKSNDALPYLLRAADRHHPEAMFRVAEIYAERAKGHKEFEPLAEECYKHAQKLGNQWGAFGLAKLHISQKERHKELGADDLEKMFEGFEWDTEPLVAIGELIYQRWVKNQQQDLKYLCKYYWLKAAAQGSIVEEAWYSLGFWYHIMAADWASAFPWYERAAYHNHADALYRLGLHAKATDKRLSRALLERAAKIGHTSAQNELESFD